MRKLFIGCGILVLLILGLFGYVAYRIGSEVKELQSQWAVAFERIQVLERRFPFDADAQTELNAPRFALVLEMRATLAAEFAAANETLETLVERYETTDDFGFFDMVDGWLQTATPLLPRFADGLEAHQMSWREYAWYTRLLWACLYRVDAGVGPPELEPLRGSYERLRKAYEEVQRSNDKLPPLAELIGTFPPALVSEANTLLASDLERVERGLRMVVFEHVYMQPLTRLEELHDLQVPAPPTGAPAPALPAGAPEPIGSQPPQPPQPLGKPAPGPDETGDK